MAEEDSGALRSDAATLAAVVALVNDARAAAGLPPASPDAVVAAVDRGSRPSAPASAPGAAPRHVWVLDPVDGTLGFVRGDQYAVALALLVGGRVVVSALGCPNMPAHGASLLSTNPGDASVAYGFTPSAVSRLLAGARGAGGWVRGVLFFAQAGGGCWASPTDAAQARASAPSRVAVSDEADPAKTRMTEPVLKANSSQGFSAQVASALGMAASPLRIYSMVKYGAVARGDAHVFMKARPVACCCLAVELTPARATDAPPLPPSSPRLATGRRCGTTRRACWWCRRLGAW